MVPVIRIRPYGFGLGLGSVMSAPQGGATPLSRRFANLYERRPDLAVRDGVAKVAQNAGLDLAAAADLVARADGRLGLAGLGQAAPAPQAAACPPGYLPSVTCNPETQRVEVAGPGCQRCVAKSRFEQSAGLCIQSLQQYLVQQGQLAPGSATGVLNAETGNALNYLIGFGRWQDYPGGACGILTTLQLGQLGVGPQPAQTRPPGYGGQFVGATGTTYSAPTPLPFGLDMTSLLVLGGVVFGAMWFLRK